MKNAARCLHAFGAPSTIKVYPGASQPLLRPARYDPEIHGESGLGGVEGLPSADLEEVRARMPSKAATVRALEGMATAVRDTWKNGAGSKVTLISSGPMTNIALFSSVYPELITAIGKYTTTLTRKTNSDVLFAEEIVFMGGGVGIGNRSAAAGKLEW